MNVYILFFEGLKHLMNHLLLKLLEDDEDKDMVIDLKTSFFGSLEFMASLPS